MEEENIIPDSDEELKENYQTQISDLPDEVLENIFSRCSLYDDMENVKITCKRWYSIAQSKSIKINNKIKDRIKCTCNFLYYYFISEVVSYLQTNFEESLLQGRVDTVTLCAVVNQNGQIVPPGSWATERFGHMACYYSKIRDTIKVKMYLSHNIIILLLLL